MSPTHAPRTVWTRASTSSFSLWISWNSQQNAPAGREKLIGQRAIPQREGTVETQAVVNAKRQPVDVLYGTVLYSRYTVRRVNKWWSCCERWCALLLLYSMRGLCLKATVWNNRIPQSHICFSRVFYQLDPNKYSIQTTGTVVTWTLFFCQQAKGWHIVNDSARKRRFRAASCRSQMRFIVKVNVKQRQLRFPHWKQTNKRRKKAPS